MTDQAMNVEMRDESTAPRAALRLWVISVLVSWLAACASDQSTKTPELGVSNAYKEGAIFNDVFKIDFAAGKKSIPLPPGDWKLVSDWEFRTDVSNIPIIHFYLVRHDENKVTGIVGIITHKEMVDFGWRISNICSGKRKENAWYLHEDSYDLHEDCNIVYPLRRFSRSYEPLGGTFDYIDSNNLVMPSQWAIIRFGRSQDEDMLQVSYALPPEHYGLPREWRSRDWSVSRIQAYPEKAAFMEKANAWAKSWKGLIDRGFKNKLRKEDVTAHPRIAETGSKQQARTTIAPSGQRAKNSQLGVAVIAGDVEKVEALLSAGADPNSEVSFTRWGWNRGREWYSRVLVAAIVHEHPEVVNALLKRGVSFDKFENAFAICPAVNSAQTNIVAALIKAGIDVNPDFTCIRNLSPLVSARRRDYPEIVELLVAAGAR